MAAATLRLAEELAQAGSNWASSHAALKGRSLSGGGGRLLGGTSDEQAG